VIKWPEREAKHLLACVAEVKNAWSCNSSHSPYVFKVWCLKHRDNFTFLHWPCSLYWCKGKSV